MLLENKTDFKEVSCIIMASGIGSRFGGNKLLADFRGKPMILQIMNQIPFHLFKEVILVTRYEEILTLIKHYPIRCILHDLPYQSDTIRLGMEKIGDTKGCMFVTCDQPLRSSDSIIRLLSRFHEEEESIIRLGYKGKVGNPVIFPSKYYEELYNLQEGEKGSTVIKAHKEQVIVVEAKHEYELLDVDTREDLKFLASIVDYS